MRDTACCQLEGKRNKSMLTLYFEFFICVRSVSLCSTICSSYSSPYSSSSPSPSSSSSSSSTPDSSSATTVFSLAETNSSSESVWSLLFFLSASAAAFAAALAAAASVPLPATDFSFGCPLLRHAHTCTGEPAAAYRINYFNFFNCGGQYRLWQWRAGTVLTK